MTSRCAMHSSQCSLRGSSGDNNDENGKTEHDTWGKTENQQRLRRRRKNSFVVVVVVLRTLLCCQIPSPLGSQMLIKLFILLSLLIAFHNGIISSSIYSNDGGVEVVEPVHEYKDGNEFATLQYSCPSEGNLDFNAVDFETYDEFSTKLLRENALHDFAKTFRGTIFDDWSRTYNTIKSQMYDWKKKHYVNVLPQSNAMVYESACGIGLNLLMTLEIIQENTSPKLENITVYGNDYVEASTEIARRLTNVSSDTYLLGPVNGRLGTICRADSMKLEQFVPANTFDLVFTGYITPNENPLSLKTNTLDVHDEMYELCTSDSPDEREMSRLAQEKQNDWYGKWIKEMIRIAKPGAPIILEQVSRTLCEEYDDWGGVSRSTFWIEHTVQKYGWDVDPKSFDFGDDFVFSHNRYHVYMRKNDPDRSNQQQRHQNDTVSETLVQHDELR